jgi:hypothetical protein
MVTQARFHLYAVSMLASCPGVTRVVMCRAPFVL